MNYNWFAEQNITKLGLRRKEKIELWKLNQLLKFTDSKIKLLELGPGIGIFAELCKKNNIEYSAIEPNTKLREDLLKKGFPVKKAEVPPIPYSDSCINVIYIDQLLEHMPGHKEASKLLEESYRVLAPSGLLCIVVPDYLAEKATFFDIDYTHNFVTTKRRVSQIFYDHGFQIVCAKKYICGASGWMANLLHIICLPLKNEFARSFFELLCLEKLWIKIRKNLFELLIIIGRK